VRGAIVVQPFSQKSLVSEYSGPVLLAAGIFFLDLSVPAEVAAWLLYAIPVALTIGSSRARAPLYVMGLVACLAVTDLVVSSSGFPPVSFWLNRLLGISFCIFIQLACCYENSFLALMGGEIVTQGADIFWADLIDQFFALALDCNALNNNSPTLFTNYINAVVIASPDYFHFLITHFE